MFENISPDKSDKTKSEVFYKNTSEVKYHVLAHAKSVGSLCDPMNSSPPRLLCPWDSPGKETGMGCHCLI